MSTKSRLKRSAQHASVGGVVPMEEEHSTGSIAAKGSKSKSTLSRRKSRRKSRGKSVLRKAGDLLKGTLKRQKNKGPPRLKLGKGNFESSVWKGPETCDCAPITPEECPMFNGYSFNSTDYLGQGRYSDILKAAKNDAKGNSPDLVAVKFIKHAEDPNWDLTCVEKESRILFKLNHPNVVKYLWMHHHPGEGFLYIAMEFVSGCTFKQLIDEFPQVLNEQRMKLIAQSLLEALQHCHANGIVHHDINLSNFMLPALSTTEKTRPNEVFLGDLKPSSSNVGLFDIKLLDFGLAVEVDETDLEDCTIDSEAGTYAFSAPEIFKSDLHNCKVDLFAVGVIMFLGISQGQRYPFDDFSWMNSSVLAQYEKREKMEKVLRKQMKMHLKFQPEEIWIDVSKSAKDLVKRLLHANHRERPMASMALRHIWLDDGFNV